MLPRDAIKTARCVISVALWVWVLPAAHAMPLDADGPSGFSDNGDFDDLIVSLTSPTAAVTSVLVRVPAAWSVAIDAVVLPSSGFVHVRRRIVCRKPRSTSR